MPDDDKLLQEAESVVNRAYAPYSQFRVGAALRADSGRIYTGVNVENRSYGLTNCAERSALFSAVTDGCRSFSGIAIYCPDAEDPIPPCGACRQVLSEFCPPGMPVIFRGRGPRQVRTTIGELLPLDSLHDLKSR